MNSADESVNGHKSSLFVNEHNSQADVSTKSITPNRSNKGKSVVEIIFENQEIANKYQDNLESFLKDLLDAEETFNISVKSSVCNKNQDDLESMFCIDSVSSTSFGESGTISYTSPFSTPIMYETNVKEGKTSKSGKNSSLMCFNCLGDHHLKSCPVEHNGRRISKNRREFMEQNVPSRRYHDAFENSSREKLVPGTISNELRRALGLKPHQLPSYIYNMRLFGYPPGWLAEAVVEPSEITIIESENEIQNKFAKCQSQEKQYDFKKFYKYPGFNCPLLPGIYDEYRELRMPPMQSHQMLDEVVTYKNVSTTVSNVYKRRKQTSDKQNNELNNDNSSSSKNNETGNTSFDDKFGEREVSTPKIAKIVDDKESSSENKETPKDVREAESSSTLLGVPIIETPNTCKKLPNLSKFSEGISEHEHFENLPDATGTYNQMRSILENVRQKLFNKP